MIGCLLDGHRLGGSLKSGELLRIKLLAERGLRFIVELLFCASELAAGFLMGAYVKPIELYLGTCATFRRRAREMAGSSRDVEEAFARATFERVQHRLDDCSRHSPRHRA